MSSQPYYPPPPAHEYRSDYPDPAYASGALTTTHRPPAGAYYPSNGDSYLEPRDTRRHKHRHRSRDDRDDDYIVEDRYTRRSKSRNRSRSRSDSQLRSRAKSVGATAAGGAAGAYLAHELGGKKLGTVGTVGGLVAGAWGAHELEKQHERRREKKRFEEEGYSYGGGSDRPRHERRRSSGAGLIDGIKEKVTGFIDELDGGGKKEKRRSRSHVPSGRGRYDDYDDYDDGRYEYERTERRSRGRRDDY